MGQRMYKFIGPLICNQNRPGRVTQNLTHEKSKSELKLKNKQLGIGSKPFPFELKLGLAIASVAVHGGWVLEPAETPPASDVVDLPR